MKHERPVRIITYKGRHKTELRVFRRDIHESYCAQPDCQFFGKHSAQGICHTKLKGFPAQYFDRLFASARSTVEFYRAQYKGKSRAQWVKFLEGLVITTQCNWTSCLDELIRTRAVNAKLNNKLGTYK